MKIKYKKERYIESEFRWRIKSGMALGKMKQLAEFLMKIFQRLFQHDQSAVCKKLECSRITQHKEKNRPKKYKRI